MVIDAEGTRRDPTTGTRTSLRRSIALLSSLVAVAAVVVTVFAVAAYRQAAQVQHTRRVHLLPAADAADDLAAAALDQETGLRGFVITGDEVFLAPYVDGVVAEELAANRLEEALADEYDGIHALVSPVLDTLRQWRSEVAEPEIELVRNGRLDAAADLVGTGRGMALFDEVRERLDRLSAAIETERNDSRTALVRRVDQLFGVALGGAVVAIAAATATWFLARRRVTLPLERLAGQAADVAGGVLDRPISVGGAAEIDGVARSVERMRVQLLGEIRRAHSSGMVQAEGAERARLAGELHDDPIQVLTSAQWQLEALAARLPDDDRRAAAAVATSLAAVQGRLRTLMFRLHPPGLDDEGLHAALDDLLLDLFDDTEVDVHLTFEVPAGLAPAISTLTFRIAAEAIRNARKHAQAQSLHVWVRDTGDGVQLSVIDDGVGADLRSLPTGHHGISISRALAAAAGGWWHVHSRPGRGTTVTCWLPLAGEASDGDEGGGGGDRSHLGGAADPLGRSVADHEVTPHVPDR